MAATALTVVAAPGSAGAEVSGVACDTSNGNSFPAECLLLVRNTGVTSRTVTLTTPADAEGNAVADPQVTLTSGQNKVIGPFNPAVYGKTVTATGSHAELYFTAISR